MVENQEQELERQKRKVSESNTKGYRSSIAWLLLKSTKFGLLLCAFTMSSSGSFIHSSVTPAEQVTYLTPKLYILLSNRRVLWDSSKRVDDVSDITVGGQGPRSLMSQFSFCDLCSEILFLPLSLPRLTICPLLVAFEQWSDGSLIGSRSLLLPSDATDRRSS